MINYMIQVKNILRNNQEIINNFNIKEENIKKALSKVFRMNKHKMKKEDVKYDVILVTKYKEI